MALIEVSPIQLPGEPSVVALTGLFTELIKNQSPDQVQALTQRFLDLTEPYHKINVAVSQNIAAFLARLLHIDVKDVKYIEPPKLPALPIPQMPPSQTVPVAPK